MESKCLTKKTTTMIMLGLVLVLILVPATTNAWDAEGEAKCRQLHNVDEVSAPYTYYREKKCMLQCGIGGEYWFHRLNEGLDCPDAIAGYICRNGYCVEDVSFGQISVQINSATLPDKANAYAQVCVQNSTYEGKHPVVNNSLCVLCYTKTVQQSSSPVWNEQCSHLSQYKFREDSIVFIQLWDQQEKLMEKYLGRAEPGVGFVITKGYNHRWNNYPLSGTKHLGTVNATITWTPIPDPEH